MKAWDWSGFFDYLFNRYLLLGALTTLGLTIVALLGGLLAGSLLTLLRLSGRRWLALLAQGYIWIFRGTPLLVQLIVIYTGLPQLGIKLSVLESAALGLVLNESAYLAEILRSGILGVPSGQSRAAQALGLSRSQVMVRIVLPQAVRIVIPALGNSVNGLLKTTSLTSVISMEELLRRTQLLIQEKFLVLELFAVAALYYLMLTSMWDVVQRRIERRFGRPFQVEVVGEAR